MTSLISELPLFEHEDVNVGPVKDAISDLNSATASVQCSAQTTVRAFLNFTSLILLSDYSLIIYRIMAPFAIRLLENGEGFWRVPVTNFVICNLQSRRLHNTQEQRSENSEQRRTHQQK